LGHQKDGGGSLPVPFVLSRRRSMLCLLNYNPSTFLYRSKQPSWRTWQLFYAHISSSMDHFHRKKSLLSIQLSIPRLEDGQLVMRISSIGYWIRECLFKKHGTNSRWSQWWMSCR